ncbi:MAG: FkbM family methyltransferase [Phycisphaerales bacterium]|nr:FkbM family methyltransferase [Phycisphaerales bacterium]MCB9854164.1 FkbM family methyltransferase [Phycisphaerales bacterium]MCB9864700.1 FkbM family methyltransferase [Phycisphaerales bacterium]
MSLAHTIKYITNHPLCRDRKFAALRRFASWQIKSRLSPGPHAVPFVNATRLFVIRGSHGATGNIYCGLDEFEDMAFVLHLLRPKDLFVDVGSNVGSYTILASGAVGADSIAIEPVDSTFESLVRNVSGNRLENLVTTLNVGVAESSGTRHFTSDQDTMNHIAESGASGDTIEVKVQSLDEIVGDRNPCCIKIDVEGYERHVLKGGTHTFAKPSLLAVIVEVNSSASRYENEERFDTHKQMSDWNFVPCRYEPLTRTISKAPQPNTGGNTIYVRDLEQVAHRLSNAPAYRVLNHSI